MRKFIEEHAHDVLLMFVTILGVTRWWIPSVSGFWNMYGASQWVLSYQHGLVRRGLLGEIISLWIPIMTLKNVYDIALAAYCTLLLVLLVIFFMLWRSKDGGGVLFRLMLLFFAAPVTLSFFAYQLGRFDLFLVLITLLCMIVLSLGKHLWIVPILMIAAMFTHEGFLILYAPTIVAAMIFLYSREKTGVRVLVTLVIGVISVLCSFFILYKFGNPTVGYQEFVRLIQSRANFGITDLSMHECYFTVSDHFNLTTPYWHDIGSIINFIMAILILSPVMIVLLNLWRHALRTCQTQRAACVLFFLATLSGMILLFIATDYGRWLSACIVSNFFAIFFLVSMGIIKTEELKEYTGGSFSILYVCLLITYLLFGPLHDSTPYPYQDNILYSSLSVISVLLFDIGFCMRWRHAGREALTAGQPST